MPVQIRNKAHREDIEMENTRESSNSANEQLSSSSSSLESWKDSASKNNDDTIGSGTSFPYNISASGVITPCNSTTPLTDTVQSISKTVQQPTYPSPYIDNMPTKHYTSNNSLYNMDATIKMTEEERNKLVRKNMVVIYSSIYGVLLTITGAVIYVSQSPRSKFVGELFSTCIAIVGMAWLIFLHVDLHRYKRQIYKKVIVGSEYMDKISTCTDFNIAATFLGNDTPPYRFLRGRHSGSFYLKTGLAAFCFGHLINEGLLLGQEVVNYVQEDRYNLGCSDPASIVHHIVRPLYSFYQLFIVFKYSNIIINRYKGVACFSLMHIMATCLCFWFGTIVEDALEDYYHKLGQNLNETLISPKENMSYHESSEYAICSHLSNGSDCICSSTAILSVNNVHAMPYLYPFTIEFNILLAGVWFIVWHNIGKKDHKANPHHFQHKIHNNDGIEEITYQSNLVISADCHASNKGLFAGMFILMASIISVIIFFVAMSLEKYEEFALSIHYFQEGALTILTLGGVLIGYTQLTKLDYNLHPIHFLDDVLLFVPLPFFFMQALLIIVSEFQKDSLIRIVMSILTPVQVILQTPLIMDGLRRCSNTQGLRYKKPGREIVTFLIVCNLTMWIINTFEAKSVESHYGQDVYFGKYVWMFISHTTLPLMLFYRFHSSACLADIWKTAYDKGE